MGQPLILLTGFGPYEEVEDNPSARLVERLDADPPRAAELAVRILSVSFRGAPSELDAALASLAPRVPDAVLAVGCTKKGRALRLERRAAARPKSGRPDAQGIDGSDLRLPDAPALETPLDLEPLAGAMRAAGAPRVDLSESAGGFVCERLYRHVLERGRELGVPALFLHVPLFTRVAQEAQIRALRALLDAFARRIVGRGSPLGDR